MASSISIVDPNLQVLFLEEITCKMAILLMVSILISMAALSEIISWKWLAFKMVVKVR
jgi:hypothetical protein